MFKCFFFVCYVRIREGEWYIYVNWEYVNLCNVLYFCRDRDREMERERERIKWVFKIVFLMKIRFLNEIRREKNWSKI